jgi:hypothetical protein
MAHNTIKKTLVGPLKLYSSLRFMEKGITKIKSGTDVTLEDTGKIHIDSEGNSHKVFRIRKNTPHQNFPRHLMRTRATPPQKVAAECPPESLPTW